MVLAGWDGALRPFSFSAESHLWSSWVQLPRTQLPVAKRVLRRCPGLGPGPLEPGGGGGPPCGSFLGTTAPWHEASEPRFISQMEKQPQEPDEPGRQGRWEARCPRQGGRVVACMACCPAVGLEAPGFQKVQAACQGPARLRRGRPEASRARGGSVASCSRAWLWSWGARGPHHSSPASRVVVGEKWRGQNQPPGGLLGIARVPLSLVVASGGCWPW